MKNQNEWRTVWVRVAILFLFGLLFAFGFWAITGRLPKRMM